MRLEGKGRKSDNGFIVLYQLSYRGDAPGWTRTTDHVINSEGTVIYTIPYLQDLRSGGKLDGWNPLVQGRGTILPDHHLEQMMSPYLIEDLEIYLHSVPPKITIQ